MCESQGSKHVQHVCMKKYTTNTRAHNTFKATKDIAAGQEIFIRYGSAKWFEVKNIPYTDVDYENTMWRPDLQPLPCRQRVAPTTEADGRHSFTVVEAITSGTVLEISLCVEVSVVVVDQFPYLWDFVLTGETENDHTSCQQTSASSRAHTACVLQIKAKRILENLLRRFCISFLHSLSSTSQTRTHPKPLLGLGFVVFVRVHMKYEYMHQSNQCP